MAQQPFQIKIQKPYYGWIPTMLSMAGGTPFYSANHAFESQFDIMAGYSGYQEYSYSQAMMPNRPGFEGHLAPGMGFNAATDDALIVNGLALNSTVSNDGTCYVLLDSNRYVTLLPNFSFGYVSQSVYGTVGNYVGIHSGHAGVTTKNGDIASFTTSGTANAYAYFTWEDATDGDIAKYTGTTGTANFYTADCGGSALTKGLAHPLLVGQDRFIYFGNGNVLGKFDPETVVATDVALTLPPCWQIQGLAQYQNYIAIIANQDNGLGFGTNPFVKGQSMLFLWDAVATSWNFQYDLKDFYSSNIFYDGSDLYVITYGKNGTLKLKKFNGSGFDTLFESANIGDWPGGGNSNFCPGGMEFYLNHLVWTSQSTTNINEYGSPDSSHIPSGFHQMTTLSGQNGMVKNLFQNLLFVGNRSPSGAYSIQYSDYAQYGTNTQYVSPFNALPTNSTIDNVKLYFSQWGAGAALQVAIVKDYNTLAFGSGNDLLQWNPTVATVGTTGTYAYVSQSIANVNGFYLGLKWTHSSTSNTAAIIREIEINGFSDDSNI